MKAAIYAYSALNLAGPRSIDRQISKCRQFIESKGWTVCADYIRFDSSSAGILTPFREGLQSLITASTLNPCPFDFVVVDATYTLGRTFRKLCRVIKPFRDLGASLYFVATHVDTRKPQSCFPMIVMDLMDEECLAKLAATVDQGQKRRVLQGIVSGGRCYYGYTKIPVENHSRKGECVTQALTGYRIDLNQSEADVVRRIFDLFGSRSLYLKRSRERAR